MPRGCTTRARCGGTCPDAETHEEALRWLAYWDGLDEDGRQRERDMMSTYNAEVSARRA